MLLINYLGEIDLTIRKEVTKALADTRATLSVLNPTGLCIPLPRNAETTAGTPGTVPKSPHGKGCRFVQNLRT